MFFVIGISIAFFLDLVLISKKQKTIADKILVLWLFFIGVHLLLYYFDFTGKSYEFHYLLGVQIPLPLLHGPFLYLYTAALTNQLPYKKKFLLLHFIPAIGCWIYLVNFYALPAAEKIFVFKHEGIGYETFMIINLISIIISGIVYITWSSLLLRKHRRVILAQFSNTAEINLKWLQYLTYGLGLIWLAVIFGHEEMIFSIVVAFVFFIGYFGIKQGSIFSYNNQYEPTQSDEFAKAQTFISEERTEQQQLTTQMADVNFDVEINSDKRKYLKSGLTEKAAENLHEELTKLMVSEKLYFESELTLSDLAKRLNTHPNYLSQVINEKEEKNLYDYINTLRIEAFKNLVANPDNQRYTILSLAYECGFNSKSSFNRYFKKTTGKSPSVYLRNLKIAV